MKRLLDEPNMLEALLQPETALERHWFTLPEFRHGLLWGEPRFGHPEGQVALHVREVLDNINRVPRLSIAMRAQLRQIALTHDTFKYAEDRSRPRDWSKHHGLIARRFLEQFTQDQSVLDVTETHDDAFYAWLVSRQEHVLPGKQSRTLEHLHQKVGYCMQLYYTFFKCDTLTGDKTLAPMKWFEKNVSGIELIDLAE
ncbi:MAG: hypothetical protein KGS48_08090 [Bacteroidetes bacterium]|nr:hypothetical protein [Bacteroidota bacterium]